MNRTQRSLSILWTLLVAVLLSGCDARQAGVDGGTEGASDSGAGILDAGASDAAMADAGLPDAGIFDAGQPDAGSCAGVLPYPGTFTVRTPADVTALQGVSEIGGALLIDGGTFNGLSADCLRSIGGPLVVSDNAMTSLSFASLVLIDGGFRLAYNDALVSVSMPSLTRLGGSLDLHVDRALPSISFPALTEVGGDVVLLGMNSLQSISLPALTTVRFQNVTSWPAGVGVHLYLNDALTQLSLPALASIENGASVYVASNQNLVTVSLPRLVRGGFDLQSNPSLMTVDIPALLSADKLTIWGAASLTALEAPNLSSVAWLDLQYDDALVSLSLDRLTEVTHTLSVLNNPQLPQCLIDALVARLTDAGTVIARNNRSDCTCFQDAGALRASCP
jgi:hypothetical protein